MSRRALLAGMAGAALLPVTRVRTAPVHADAALLALCAEWTAMEDCHDRLTEEQLAANARGDKEAERRAFEAVVADVPRYHAMRDEIFQITPRTADGLRAQARVLMRSLADAPSGEDVMAYNFAEYVVRLLDGGAT